VDQRFVDLLTSCLPLVGDEPPPEDTALRELGLDSMAAVELFFGIESAFNVSLPDEALNDTVFATAGSLWKAICAALDAAEAA
jgi:acyl carrier protein